MSHTSNGQIIGAGPTPSNKKECPIEKIKDEEDKQEGKKESEVKLDADGKVISSDESKGSDDEPEEAQEVKNRTNFKIAGCDLCPEHTHI